MNLCTHRSRTAERNSTGADTEGCAPFDTTATSHGEDMKPCPIPPDVRVGLQPRMTLALIKSDSNEILPGAETDGFAPIDAMSEWDSNRG